ncbi:hypothetical protein DFH27DRAFT_544598 [Peziza echinospora]|nr:hypothetical protein DFH27DRAFT_544598 [Peziza echinospora]
MTEVLSAPSRFEGHYRPTSSPRRRHSVSPPSTTSSIPRSYQQPVKRIDTHSSYTAQTSTLKGQSNAVVSRVPVPQTERAQFLFCDFEDDGVDEDLAFPVYEYAETITPDASPDLDPPSTYSESCTTSSNSSSTVSPHNSPDLDHPVLIALDDNTIKHEPSRHVDYLSHNWKEEDIWSSWRYMVGKRNVYQNSARLENASWRTWAKAKYNLKTLSPEKLNWLKDCDVTWLYGPLSTGDDKISQYTSPMSPSAEQPMQSLNALTQAKKPILKKRSMSEVMLQRSLSTSSLLKQAAAAIHSQQSEISKTARPSLAARANSDFSTYPFHYISESVVSTNELPSALSTGTHSPSYQRHIHFNNRVEQCIAVDKGDDQDHHYSTHEIDDDSDSSDDGLVMMAPSRGSSRSTPRGSFSEHQTIAMLPSTTLKPAEDLEALEAKKDDTISNAFTSFLSGPIGPSLYNGYAGAPAPPTAPIINGSASDSIIQSNFLVDDEDDDTDDYAWQPNGFANRRDSIAISRPKFGLNSDSEDSDKSKAAAVDSDSDEGDAPAGLLGRAVDAVNTARDIAHVLWNVGWRK